MDAQEHLVIVSLMSGNGFTGVETHFREIAAAAQSRGIQSTLVSPAFDARWRQRLWHLPVRLVGLISKEEAYRLFRRMARHRVRKKLARILNATRGAVTLYAQDPLSAEICLGVRDTPGRRVVCVTHFNISEAHELETLGMLKKGGTLRRELEQTEASSLGRVDSLIFVSRDQKRRVMERLSGRREAITHVLPNFVSRPGSPARAAPVGADAVCIGSLEARKNQAHLLRVIAACRDLGHHYRLDIIGDGGDRAALEALRDELGLMDHVRFLGFMPKASAMIVRYRVVLHAARMESFGIVLIEAMAAGKPVFAFPTGGIPEVFRDNVEGIYWSSDDPTECARQLIGVLDNNATLERLSRSAVSTFNQRFDPETLADRWLSAILGRAVFPD